MCGIVGYLNPNGINEDVKSYIHFATQKLNNRGPDYQDVKHFPKASLGHARLSILDTSSKSNQPFFDRNREFVMVFNGEIYNYKELKEELESEGITFQTTGDTEVLLECYKKYGTSFLNKLNGFFALAIYDIKNEETILARDRFGIKPLLYFNDQRQFIFASEMKAITVFGIEKTMDMASVYTYFQLNYIPEPHSIYTEIKKLSPGHYLKIDRANKIQKIPFFQLNYGTEGHSYTNLSYDAAQKRVISLLDQSVEKRLVSDVPLGTFLSGGIDSSLITALASRKVKHLNTFSIGYKDEPFFDETKYALEVSKKYMTNHHVFKLKNQDLLESLYETLEYIDEPFADSSALAVNLLSKYTASHVKVALSGDGADELFSGYHKHMAEFLVRQKGVKNTLVKSLHPLWDALPKSRNSQLGNLIRKFNKYSKGSKLGIKERYWSWASLMNEAEAKNLLLKEFPSKTYVSRKANTLSYLTSSDFNDVLLTDVNLVLTSDMLRKVDLMSMRNSLEVRTPFLDHELVRFAFNLPAHYKIDRKMKKKLLQDASRELLPDVLYNRPKKGFEVPLHKWFTKELKSYIEKEIIAEDFIREQNLFNPTYVKNLWTKVNSSSPEDSPANMWALIVFNSWYKRQID